MNIFMEASRLKLRFSVVGIGTLSVEDLWDLSEQQLNDVFMDLSKASKMSDVESLLDSSGEDKILTVKKNIVRSVFDVKKAEREERQEKARLREEYKQLLEVMSKKQGAELEKMSESDLAARLEELREKLS